MGKQSLEEVSRKLHSAALHLMRYVRTQDTAMGIGPAQASALSIVAFGGPRSLGELAEAEQVRPPTMSRIVDALVTGELVKREVSSSDRRAVTSTATEKGTRLMHEGRSRREKQLNKLLKHLTTNEVDQLDRASDIIMTALRSV
jgi:DNA-binding MarR family transcriptional regulator